MPQNPYMDEAFCDTRVWIWDTCFMSLFCKYAREVFPGVETLNNFYEVIHIQHADNPPLFSWVEYENALISGDLDYIKELLYTKQFLQKHYFWVENLKEQKKFPGVFAPNYLIADDLGYRINIKSFLWKIKRTSAILLQQCLKQKAIKQYSQTRAPLLKHYLLLICLNLLFWILVFLIWME